jgi:ATP-dependent RNA helicase DeaD
MDHLRRGTLKIDDTRMVVLDEADEMLNMGFIEDVRWILDHIKAKHQTALFSATMPKSIQAIAKDYLTDPKKVIIKAVKSTASNIEQRYCFMPMQKKLDALTRIIEAEDMTAAIIFVRTKTASNDIALKLQARGYAAAALNGDMNQEARKKVIAQMKKGTIDMVVATDVAARGIDINRVSHVINYDIPHDCETYTHRIGRTGRAGREGVAILFATGKEERLLRAIERSSPTPLIQMRLPTAAVIHAKRNQTLVDDICAKAQKKPDLSFAQDLVNQLQQAGLSPDELAVILAHHIQSQQPSLAGSDDFSTKRSSSSKDGARRDRGRSQSCRRDGGAPSRRPRKDAKDRWEKKGSSEGKRSAGKKDSKESWEKKDKKDSKRSTDKKIKKDKKSPKEKKAKLKKIAKQSTRRAGASKTGKSKKES